MLALLSVCFLFVVSAAPESERPPVPTWDTKNCETKPMDSVMAEIKASSQPPRQKWDLPPFSRPPLAHSSPYTIPLVSNHHSSGHHSPTRSLSHHLLVATISPPPFHHHSPTTSVPPPLPTRIPSTSHISSPPLLPLLSPPLFRYRCPRIAPITTPAPLSHDPLSRPLFH